MNEKCDQFGFGGCCCNCKMRTAVKKHDGTLVCYACIVEHSFNGKEGAEVGRSLLLGDVGHGFCEMYAEINND